MTPKSHNRSIKLLNFLQSNGNGFGEVRVSNPIHCDFYKAGWSLGGSCEESCP